MADVPRDGGRPHHDQSAEEIGRLAGVLATPTHAVTCNFALDPRNNGDNVFKGFFYQGQYDGNLYELSLDGGKLEKINVSSMLETFGAPIPSNSNYWMRGVFTSYGYTGAGGVFSPNPYLLLWESDFNPTARSTCTCGNCPNSNLEVATLSGELIVLPTE